MKYAEFAGALWIIEGCEVKILQFIPVILFSITRGIKTAHLQKEGSQAVWQKQIMDHASAVQYSHD